MTSLTTHTRWVAVLAIGAIMLASCSKPAASAPSATETVNPVSIDAVNCPNTWQLTTARRGLNPRSSHSLLTADVIPPHALWVAFCLYGEPSSATSNAAGVETLVLGGGTVARKQHSLITDINNGQVVKDPATATCLADNGQTYVLLFTYHHAPTVRVAASLFGCRYITNGITTVDSPKVTARLLAMAGTHTQGGPPIPTATTSP